MVQLLDSQFITATGVIGSVSHQDKVRRDSQEFVDVDDFATAGLVNADVPEEEGFHLLSYVNLLSGLKTLSDGMLVYLDLARMYRS